MEVLSVIMERRSIRNFEDKQVSREAVDKLIEALLWAPSAGNLQSRKFYFVTEAAIRQKLAMAAYGQGFIARAPLVVVACADKETVSGRYGRRGVELDCVQDATLSAMCMMLEACELGLGSVWVGAFNEKDVSKALELPEDFRPVAILPVGYPLIVPDAPARVRAEEAVIFK